MNKKKETILHGIIVLMISQFFVKIIGFFYKLYLTNKEGFGDTGNAIYSGGFQIYVLLLTLSSTGISNAISKMLSERLANGKKNEANRIFKIAFVIFGVIGACSSFVLFLLAKIIANKWLQIPEAHISLICLSPSIFFVTLSSVFKGFFNGGQFFSETAKAQTIEQILKTVLTIVMVEFSVLLTGLNTRIMAGAANLATTFATGICFFYILKCYRKIKNEKFFNINSKVEINSITKREILKEILNVAMPISIGSLLSSFNKNIDSFTIVRFLKNYLSEENAKIQYGILSGKVDTLCNLPFSFNVAFVTTLVPSIAKSMAKNNIFEIKKKTKIFLLISFFISIPITLGMFLFPSQILYILFPNAKEGSLYLKYNSLCIVFMLLTQTINGILQGMGKVKIPIISFGIGMIFKFLCNIFLIPIKKIGIFGAIIGNIICNVIAFLISFLALFKYCKKENC